MKSIKSLNRILWASEYWFRALKCQFWLTNTKLFFWESEANLESLQKRSPNIWVSYKLVLKSVKVLNRISWATESCFKAWFKAFSPCIWAFYKFILKSVKSLNWILWALEYWFRALKCQFWLTNTKPFFWESKVNVETLQKPSIYIRVLYKFVLKSEKT